MRLFVNEDQGGSGSPSTPDLSIYEKSASERFPVMGVELIDLKDLKLDAGTQFRHKIRPETIEDYTQVVLADFEAKREVSFPPIDVFRDPVSNENVVADGFQRIAAHKAVKGVRAIKANVRFGTERDAVFFAAGANHSHGERRDPKTVQNQIAALAADPEFRQLSNRAIAGIVHCSEGTVRNHWPAAATRTAVVSKGGKTVDTTAIGKPEAAAKKKEAKVAQKAEKKAAKKANAETSTGNGKATPKSGKAPADPKPKAEKSVKDILAKELATLEKSIGGKEGKGIVKGIIEGTLKLSTKDVQAWAGMSTRNQAWIAPLVVERGFKPDAAIEFLNGEVSPKLLGELVLRAMAGRGKATINQIVDGHGIRATIELVKKR